MGTKMGGQQKLALIFLLIVGILFASFLLAFAFFPALYHTPLFGSHLTLGIPLAFFFMTTIFALMIYFVLNQ